MVLWHKNHIPFYNISKGRTILVILRYTFTCCCLSACRCCTHLEAWSLHWEKTATWLDLTSKHHSLLGSSSDWLQSIKESFINFIKIGQYKKITHIWFSGILMPQAKEINYKSNRKKITKSLKQHTLCRLRVFSLICSTEKFSEMGGSSSTLQSLSGCSMNPWACSYANLQHDFITDRPNHSS